MTCPQFHTNALTSSPHTTSPAMDHLSTPAGVLRHWGNHSQHHHNPSMPQCCSIPLIHLPSTHTSSSQPVTFITHQFHPPSNPYYQYAAMIMQLYHLHSIIPPSYDA